MNAAEEHFSRGGNYDRKSKQKPSHDICFTDLHLKEKKHFKNIFLQPIRSSIELQLPFINIQSHTISQEEKNIINPKQLVTRT